MMSIVRISVLVAVTVLFAGCSSAETAQPAGGPPPPVPVRIAVAEEELVPVEVRAFGTVEAFASVEVKSQVGGPLLSVRFAEGSNVNKGDLLFEIDPRPYQEALRQAESAFTKNTAQLRLAEANVARDKASQKNVDADAARYAELAREGIATRMQQDQIRTAADMARESVRASEAAVESIRAALESDRSSIDSAKLNLSYCQIQSPISGRAGNLLVNAGNLVKANDVPLVVINQIAPIFVTFGVPERQLGIITAKGSRKLPVVVQFEDGSPILHGALSVIDNKVDPATGTVRLKATFDNNERTLWPGRFVHAVMTVDKQMATVIPSESVQAGQQGPFVYIVKADKSVEPRPVVVGASVQGKVIIEKGVAAGETVVMEGQSRLYPGASIQAAESAAKPAVPGN